MPAEAFEVEVAALGLSLDSGQIAAFRTYRDLILEAAERFNLTAVRQAGEIERRHFLESLALGQALVGAQAMPAAVPCRAIDIGSGAGIPGIAVKIGWPSLEMSLLESNEKRCQFLRQVIDRLDLEDTQVLEGRAEVWARDPRHREAYDLAIGRAVAPLPVLLEYALPFLRVDGYLAAPKGSAAQRELVEAAPALKELGGEIVETIAFTPPGSRSQTLILVRKAGATPERYPRRTGVPARRPLA
jgi:16S rRNA (guanine527-N7)-methyltransferase